VIDGTGARELDADGALVTPGFVDIHCHYDGPATWDERLQPCGQRPGRLTVAGAASAVAGLGLVLELMGNTEVAAVGVLWGLGAAVGLATYFVVAETEEALPPLVVAWGGLVNRGGSCWRWRGSSGCWVASPSCGVDELRSASLERVLTPEEHVVTAQSAPA